MFSKPFCAWFDPQTRAPWAAFALTAGPPRASVFDGRQFLDAPSSLPIPHDEWTHLAIVQTGKTTDTGSPELIFYVDGVPRKADPHEAQGASPAMPAAATRLFLGSLPGAPPGQPTLDADIDELHILRAALNEPEIRDLMDANQVIFERK